MQAGPRALHVPDQAAHGSALRSLAGMPIQCQPESDRSSSGPRTLIRKRSSSVQRSPSPLPAALLAPALILGVLVIRRGVDVNLFSALVPGRLHLGRFDLGWRGELHAPTPPPPPPALAHPPHALPPPLTLPT